jgi:hypothetical protein
MPNAKDVQGSDKSSFLIVGPPGSGKTTQFWSVAEACFNSLGDRGRGFIYIFDPNCLESIRGLDVDYEEFSPDKLDINVKPLSSKKNPDNIINPIEPVAYVEWERHFDNMIDSGTFNKYAWFGFDSFTTFSDMVMDRVQWLNERSGKHPEQADYTAQMQTIRNVARTLAARNKLFIATGHEDLKRDDMLQRVVAQPYLTGKLKLWLPILFSNILRAEANGGKYSLFTVSDRMHRYVRCSLRGFPAELDTTIETDNDGNFIRAARWGIGRMLGDAGYLAAPDPSDKPAKVVSLKKRR